MTSYISYTLVPLLLFAIHHHVLMNNNDCRGAVNPRLWESLLLIAQVLLLVNKYIGMVLLLDAPTLCLHSNIRHFMELLCRYCALFQLSCERRLR